MCYHSGSWQELKQSHAHCTLLAGSAHVGLLDGLPLVCAGPDVSPEHVLHCVTQHSVRFPAFYVGLLAGVPLMQGLT
jgi:hypothetical protein